MDVHQHMHTAAIKKAGTGASLNAQAHTEDAVDPSMRVYAIY